MPPQNLPLNNPNQSTSNRPLVQVSGCTAPKMGQGTRRGVWSCGHWYHSFDAQPLPQCFVPGLKIQRFHLNLPLSRGWRVNQSDSHDPLTRPTRASARPTTPTQSTHTPRHMRDNILLTLQAAHRPAPQSIPQTQPALAPTKAPTAATMPTSLLQGSAKIPPYPDRFVHR